MRVSNHPAYEAAVRNYAKTVHSPDAPQTPGNSYALGILVGVCSVLEISHTSEGVKVDVASARAAFWAPAKLVQP